MDTITTTAKQENETQEQPPLKIQIGNQSFVAIKYWRENNDFIFITNNNEQYHCTNTYPISMKFDGIDCSPTEELTITGSITQYQK